MKSNKYAQRCAPLSRYEEETYTEGQKKTQGIILSFCTPVPYSASLLSKPRNTLKVKAQLDTNEYIAGIKIPDELIGQINLSKASFHGEWNYMISPSLFALSDIYDEYLKSAKETKKKKNSD